MNRISTSATSTSKRRGWRGAQALLVSAALVLGSLGLAVVAASPAGAQPTQWSFPNPPPPPQGGFLEGVSCSSTAFCVAVGTTATRTVIETFNGTSWTITPSPNTSPSDSDLLEAVSCTSSTFCVAAGYYFPTGGGPQRTLIETFNGSSWSITPSPNASSADPAENLLRGVSCSSASFCVAVGGETDTLIETFNGTSWSLTSSPDEPGEPWNPLTAVSCTSATFCAAVGVWSTSPGGAAPYQNLAEIFDGGSWTLSPTADTNPMNNALFGVSCTGSSLCVAVGQGGNGALVETFNGSSWPVTSVTASGQLNGVSCVNPTDCVAAGFVPDGSGGVNQTLIDSFDGTSWSETPSPDTSVSASNDLLGVSCPGTATCVAAGSDTSGTLIETGTSPSATTTTLSSQPNPSFVSQSVTFTATVSSATGTPTGTVTFSSGGNTLGTATIDSSGQAAIATSALPPGNDAVTATYSGDSKDAASSGSLTQTVIGCPTGETAHLLTATTNAGTLHGLFCVNARGFGTYEQGSVSGFGTVLTFGNLKVIAARGRGLALYGTSFGTFNRFDEVAPLRAHGTFSLS